MIARALLGLVLALPLAATWSLSGEALLLRPSVGLPYTSIIAPNRGFVRPVDASWIGNTKPSYQWGYRIALGGQVGEVDGAIRWMSWIHTYPYQVLSGEDQEFWLMAAVVSQFPRPVTGVFNRSDQYKVQVVDSEMGYTGAYWPFSLRFHVGARYSRIVYTAEFLRTGADPFGFRSIARTVWSSDIQGTGPSAGLGVRCTLRWSCYLSGGARCALLLSSAKGSEFNRYFSQPINSNFESARAKAASFLLGNCECHFGFGGDWDLGVLFLNIEIGYLVNYFSEGFVRIRSLDDHTGSGQASREVFALDGWNFRIGVSY